MALLAAHDLGLALGGPPLLDGATFQIDKGERIGLVGRNGAGKSTLLAVLAGQREVDSGTLDRQPGLRVALLPQEVPQGLEGTVVEAITAGVDLHAGEDPWARDQRVIRTVTRLRLPADDQVAGLSGGMLRRVMLARALAAEPDILLLDEPTNHLDIETITWLEEVLAREIPTLMVVTHDRTLLRTLCTRVFELDRGRLLDFPGGYDDFVEHRDELLKAESLAWQRLDRKLAEEEAWIRQGIKARRTRNEGRVRALERLRQERRERREQPGAVRLELAAAERGGRLVLRAEDVSFAYEEREVIRSFSTTVLRGDRIGIIGPNGAGKTTLLELLLGQLTPRSGTLRLGANVQMIHFDQLREQLDPEKSVRDNLGLDSDEVVIGGRARHVTSYLQDFLFSPERARQPVRALSGGERNRLLLARIFSREANVLALDEPTNDLDLDTLDLLEELLADFPGTLLLVSHDRALLDRVVTSVLVVSEDGSVQESVGGYADWVRQRPAAAAAPAKKAAREKPAAAASRDERPRKLTFKERRELDDLPLAIERLEAEQATLHARLADPALYRAAPQEVADHTLRLEALQAELAAVYARWEELEPFA